MRITSPFARARAVVLALALLPGLSSCWWRKPKVQPPPANLPPPKKTEPPKTPVVAPPPKIETQTPEAPELPETLPATPEPVQAKKKSPRRRPAPVTPAPKTAPPSGEPQTPAPDPNQPPATAMPKLSQILSEGQQREYNRVLDSSLDRVRRAIGTLARKTLSTEDTESLNRIRTFLKQAEDARGQDLVIAVNLATRADLLARDLLARVP